MKRPLFWTAASALLIVALFGAFAWHPIAAKSTEHRIVKYRNPMDPTILSDHPMKDNMGMDYIPVYADEQAAGVPKADHKIIKYRNPMDPTIFSDHPMKDNMGMDYIPVYADEQATEAPKADHKIIKYRNPMDPTIFSDHPMKDNMGMDYIPVYADEQAVDTASSVPGRGAFSLDAERRQMINLRTEVAAVRPLARTLRLPGRIGQAAGSVLAQALESDGPQLEQGQKAEILLPGQAALAAKVVGVERSLDAFSHTFGVRLALVGPAPAFLRPGMYCEVRVSLWLGRALVVPQEAILDNGQAQWVFVDKGDGRLEPRAVALGVEGDDGVEVLSGLSAGDKVVTSGNFLVDSESSFHAAAADFGGGGHD